MERPPLCIAAATPQELAPAAKRLGISEDLIPDMGCATPALLPGRSLMLLATGVGPVNAAFALGQLLGERPLSGVLHVGIAGSFDLNRAPLGAVAVATRECFPEYGVRRSPGATGADAKALHFPQYETGGAAVWDVLELDPDGAARDMGVRLDPAWPRGAAVTVAGVTADPAEAVALQRRYDALTESMEGFALALGCFRARVPFLECRTISNGVAERDKAKWDFKAALRAIGECVGGLLG